jgi:hypothetical protein
VRLSCMRWMCRTPSVGTARWMPGCPGPPARRRLLRRYARVGGAHPGATLPRCHIVRCESCGALGCPFPPVTRWGQVPGRALWRHDWPSDVATVRVHRAGGSCRAVLCGPCPVGPPQCQARTAGTARAGPPRLGLAHHWLPLPTAVLGTAARDLHRRPCRRPWEPPGIAGRAMGRVCTVLLRGDGVPGPGSWVDQLVTEGAGRRIAPGTLWPYPIRPRKQT